MLCHFLLPNYILLHIFHISYRVIECFRFTIPLLRVTHILFTLLTFCFNYVAFFPNRIRIIFIIIKFRLGRDELIFLLFSSSILSQGMRPIILGPLYILLRTIAFFPLVAGKVTNWRLFGYTATCRRESY